MALRAGGAGALGRPGAASSPRVVGARSAASGRTSETAAVLERLEKTDTVIFDCDGVIWRGAQKIEGADECIRALEAACKRVFYLTNNSAKSRQGCADKLQSVVGVAATAEQIIASSSSAAAYLGDQGFDKRGKVLVIGKPRMETAGTRE